MELGTFSSFLGNGISTALGVGGLLSNSSANRQNQANFNEQMNFARYQYEDTKQWNSPRNQVNQLRAAGLNPALTFGNGVQQQSAVSQPSPVGQQPLDMSALTNLGTALSLNTAQAANLDADTQKKQTETSLGETDLLTRSQENLLRLDTLRQQLKKDGNSTDLIDKQIEDAKIRLKFLEENQEWQAEITRLQARGQALDVAAKEIQNRYLPMLNDAQIAQIVSTLALNYAAAGEHKANIKLIAQKTANEVVQGGILSNQFWTGSPDAHKQEAHTGALKDSPGLTQLELVLETILSTLGSVFSRIGK